VSELLKIGNELTLEPRESTFAKLYEHILFTYRQAAGRCMYRLFLAFMTSTIRIIGTL
jgi:hypothetical protein